jgi:group I intron endonuclease
MTCGIYAITNTVTQRMYVGSSHNIEHRWYTHRKALGCQEHISAPMQEDWDKYGASSFTWQVLEEVAEEKDIRVREEYYITLHSPFYNRTRVYTVRQGRPAKYQSRRKVGMDLPPELVEAVDAAALRMHMTRTEFTERALREKLAIDDMEADA